MFDIPFFKEKTEEKQIKRSKKRNIFKASILSFFAAAVPLGIFLITPFSSDIKSWVAIIIVGDANISDVLATDLGIEKVEEFSEYVANIVSVIIVYVLSFTLLLVTFFTQMAKLHSKELAAVQQQSEAYRDQIFDIKNHIDEGASYKEPIRIGVFSKLLAYTPLYVADHLKFFADEGLDVEIVSAGGDQEVVDGLRDHQYNFGACDPIFTLENRQKSSDQLKILIPLVKRLDITAFCTENVFQTRKDQILRITCYNKPSTSHSAAEKLKKDLTELNLFSGIEITTLQPKSEIFSSPLELLKYVENTDIILLWNPASSWFTQNGYAPPTGKKWLRVVCNKNVRITSNIDHWNVAPLGEILPEQSYDWNPHNAAQKGYQVLSTGLLVSQHTWEHRPELCKKIFRAISRALVRLEGAKWHIEENCKPSIFSMIDQSVDDTDYLPLDIIKRLVSNPDLSEGPSLFPFIQGASKYDRSDYTGHMKNLVSLWEKSDQLPEMFEIPGVAKTDFEGYFISFNE